MFIQLWQCILQSILWEHLSQICHDRHPTAHWWNVLCTFNGCQRFTFVIVILCSLPYWILYPLYLYLMIIKCILYVGSGHLCGAINSKLTIIGSDNGLSPDRRQAIIWTNTGILSIRPLGTKLSEMLIAIHYFPFKKMRLKISSAKWRPVCLGLNVLISRCVVRSRKSSTQCDYYCVLLAAVAADISGLFH